MATILAYLTAISGIATALYGIFKGLVWLFATTPEQKKEDIAKQLQEEEKKTEQSGRPQ